MIHDPDRIVEAQLDEWFAGERHDFDVSLDLFNALNANAGWVTTYQSGPTFGYVTSLASPRAARFGAAFSF